MGDYISRGAAIAFMNEVEPCFCHDPAGAVFTATKDKDMLEFLRDIPAADVVEVVRCRDCKHRIVNEHFGEKGYMKLKAMCELDTGDPFELGKSAEDDDWFCADGERKDEGEP